MMMWNGSAVDGDDRNQCEEDESPDCEQRESDTDWYRQMEYDMLCV